MKVLLIIVFLCACSTNSAHKVTTKKEPVYKSPRGGSINAQILIEKDTKKNILPNSSISKITLKPGVVIPPHKHSSDEYLHFLKGNGEMKINGKKVKIKNNQTIFIPKGMSHSYTNNTKLKTRAIQVYSPAGPEQKYKKWKDDEY